MGFPMAIYPLPHQILVQLLNSLWFPYVSLHFAPRGKITSSINMFPGSLQENLHTINFRMSQTKRPISRWIEKTQHPSPKAEWTTLLSPLRGMHCRRLYCIVCIVCKYGGMYVQVVTCYRHATEPDTHNYNYGTGPDRIIEQTSITQIIKYSKIRKQTANEDRKITFIFPYCCHPSCLFIIMSGPVHHFAKNHSPHLTTIRNWLSHV